MTATIETTARCDASKVIVGSVFSRHSHGVVTDISGQNYGLRNEHGFEWTIRGRDILEAEFSFADQYEDTLKDSRTKIIEVLRQHSHTAMTIVFNKKVDPKVVAKELAAGQGSLSSRAWTAKVKSLMEGEERTMIGHHSNHFDEHQRLVFIEQGKGPRLVDPRTIKSLTVGRLRYEVK